MLIQRLPIFWALKLEVVRIARMTQSVPTKINGVVIEDKRCACHIFLLPTTHMQMLPIFYTNMDALLVTYIALELRSSVNNL